MNIVVTGATSFIGAPMVRELLRRGHSVYAVVRPFSKNRSKLRPHPSLHIVERELELCDHLEEVIAVSCPVFFHFGWDGAGSENRTDQAVQQKNVADSLKVMEGAGRLGCRTFLFSGSQAEYGIHGNRMNEETKLNPVSEYGKAKVDFCRQAEALSAKLGINYIHARIFSVYGPGDHPWSLVESCLDAFTSGGYISLGECSQMWNFLYIDDLIRALVRLSECAQGGIFNVAGPERETRPLKEYVRLIYETSGFLGSYSFGRRKQNAEGPANLIPDISKLEAATGWKAKVEFAEGIRWMIEMRNKICIACGAQLPETPLMVLDNMPASAQDIPDQTEVGSDSGISLHLHQCEACGLVQFDCEPVAYYQEVIRSGGFSTTMVELRRRQYRHLIETYRLEGKKFLEAGCGQGEFLSVLREFPVEIFGIEHREPLVELARKKGLRVWRQFTEAEDTVLGDENCHGPYDVFLSFNFLEHQPEPVRMLRCLWNNLTEDGMGLITVPSFEYILENDGYYELIRDHLAYYTFDTLRFVLEEAGFEVLEEEMVNRDTLSVIVKKVSRRDNSENTAKGAVCHAAADISGLVKSQVTIQQEISGLVASLREQGRSMAVWGASHQGFTLAATTGLGGCAQYMIDSAPFKQGRFAPASHIPIVSPDHFTENPVDCILIVAPGYTDEIADTIRTRFGAAVEILTLRSNHLETL